ncbi:MAG: hypothetical protein RL344_1041 [Pseudomonadota bacterium]|jgi:nitronate monooxygenase
MSKVLFSEYLSLPVIAAPLFIISNPLMVIEQCKAGIIGSFPSLNARSEIILNDWLVNIKYNLAAYNAVNPNRPAAPFAVNLIAHHSNKRLETDLALCVEHKVPLIITSLGARTEVNDAIHSYGGKVFHDVIHVEHAKKALTKGSDGLIAVAAGAGGHAGLLSPFALVQEIRQFFQGPLALSGSIANGSAILASTIIGADYAYIGSAFIATTEANASEAYKQMIVDSVAGDIVYSNLFTGVYGNYLKKSIVNAGINPDNLPENSLNDIELLNSSKVWKDIWGAGHGVGAINKIQTISNFIQQLKKEYLLVKDSIILKYEH